MPDNPYAPPQSIQTPKSRVRTQFERISAYQSKAIYLGLAIMIGIPVLAAILKSPLPWITPFATAFASLGGLLFVLAVLLTLPLSIWGIIDGYHAGRKNRLAAEQNANAQHTSN